MRTRAVTAFCLLAGLLTPVAAQATITPTGLATTASNTGAATRPDFTVAFNLTASPTSDDAKRIVFDLPAGMLGDVHAVPKCTPAQLNGDSCPAATKIGTTGATVDAIISLDISGDVYAMAAQGTEAARMGVVLRPGIADKIKLQASVRVRSDDYGLRATLDDLPRQATGVPIFGTLDIRMKDLEMKLLGATSGGLPFISAPTACTPATTRVEVTSYAGPVQSATKSYTPTNCAAVPFAPTASIAVAPATPDAPTQTSLTLAFPATATPRVQSHLRSATIALPDGMEINPAAASAGLAACADAEFAVASSAVPACPAASAVGDITIDNAQLGTLSGSVFLGAATPGNLMRLFIVAQRSAAADDVRVKLTGSVTADPATGRVTAQLDGIPQVPFRSMTMRLRGGQHGILRTPRACGQSTLGTALTPWSGTAAASPAATLRIDGACGDPARFTPSVGIAATPAQAGATTTLQATITRPDGDARLAGARISLPDGLMGKLTGVPQCPLADARAAACPAATRVGSATASVGAGPAPLGLAGDLYLTPPADGGLAGLVLTVDAKVGPLDLGRIAVPMELRLREGGTGIDVVAGDIPRRVQGIPLDLRSIDLRIDRAGFLLNPTGCGPRPLAATLTSDLGGTASASAPFAVTGCDKLGYAPRLRMALSGEIKKNGHPAIAAELRLPAGQANTQHVALLLPEGLAPDSERLGTACPLVKAQAGACPPSSKIGEAAATTPALPDELRGTVHLVTVPGSPLPELFVRLDGAARIDMRGAVSFSKGRSLVTFAGIPDVPLELFRLDLAGGLRGAIASARDLCTGAAPTVGTDLRAHSGAKRTGPVAAAVEGCRAGTGGAKVSVRLRRLRDGQPLLQVTARAGDTALRRVRVTLPKGFRVDTKRARRLANISGTARGRKALKAGKRTLTLDLGGKGARKVTLNLKRGAVRVGGAKLRRARMVRVNVQATPTTGLPTKLTLKVKPAKR